jgi:hypothetical protein
MLLSWGPAGASAALPAQNNGHLARSEPGGPLESGVDPVVPEIPAVSDAGLPTSSYRLPVTLLVAQDTAKLDSSPVAARPAPGLAYPERRDLHAGVLLRIPLAGAHSSINLMLSCDREGAVIESNTAARICSGMRLLRRPDGHLRNQLMRRGSVVWRQNTIRPWLGPAGSPEFAQLNPALATTSIQISLRLSLAIHRDCARMSRQLPMPVATEQLTTVPCGLPVVSASRTRALEMKSATPRDCWIDASAPVYKQVVADELTPEHCAFPDVAQMCSGTRINRVEPLVAWTSVGPIPAPCAMAAEAVRDSTLLPHASVARHQFTLGETTERILWSSVAACLPSSTAATYIPCDSRALPMPVAHRPSMLLATAVGRKSWKATTAVSAPRATASFALVAAATLEAGVFSLSLRVSPCLAASQWSQVADVAPLTCYIDPGAAEPIRRPVRVPAGDRQPWPAGMICGAEMQFLALPAPAPRIAACADVTCFQIRLPEGWARRPVATADRFAPR